NPSPSRSPLGGARGCCLHGRNLSTPLPPRWGGRGWVRVGSENPSPSRRCAPGPSLSPLGGARGCCLHGRNLSTPLPPRWGGRGWVRVGPENPSPSRRCAPGPRLAGDGLLLARTESLNPSP